jgi:hypothetical protein
MDMAGKQLERRASLLLHSPIAIHHRKLSFNAAKTMMNALEAAETATHL